MEAKQTPLIELLERVPQDARVVVEHDQFSSTSHPVGRLCHEAVAALRAALAEPEQEPVAWMVYTLDGKSVCVTDNPNDFGPEHKALPLYTAPTPRKPVAVVTRKTGNPGITMSWWHEPALPVGTSLYTAPISQSKPLTDEKIKDILLGIDPDTKRLPPGFRDFARAIEKAHGIGEQHE